MVTYTLVLKLETVDQNSKQYWPNDKKNGHWMDIDKFIDYSSVSEQSSVLTMPRFKFLYQKDNTIHRFGEKN